MDEIDLVLIQEKKLKIYKNHIMIMLNKKSKIIKIKLIFHTNLLFIYINNFLNKLFTSITVYI